MSPGTEIKSVGPHQPDPEVLAKTARIIKNGGLIIFPTRCLYGLGVDAMNERALDGLFRAKRRPEAKPVLVLVKDLEAVFRLIKPPPSYALDLMEKIWPGRLTLIFEARSGISARLTAGTGKIGIRIPGHPVARALVETIAVPISGTSANISGKAGCSDIANLDPELLKSVDLVLDAGSLKGGAGSTVLDVTGSSPRIIRQGEITESEITSRNTGNPQKKKKKSW